MRIFQGKIYGQQQKFKIWLSRFYEVENQIYKVIQIVQSQRQSWYNDSARCKSQRLKRTNHGLFLSMEGCAQRMFGLGRWGNLRSSRNAWAAKTGRQLRSRYKKIIKQHVRQADSNSPSPLKQNTCGALRSTRSQATFFARCLPFWQKGKEIQLQRLRCSVRYQTKPWQNLQWFKPKWVFKGLNTGSYRDELRKPALCKYFRAKNIVMSTAALWFNLYHNAAVDMAMMS